MGKKASPALDYHPQARDHPQTISSIINFSELQLLLKNWLPMEASTNSNLTLKTSLPLIDKINFNL